jgi:hypothetical protein
MKIKFAMHYKPKCMENWPDFQDPMDPGKDASNRRKLDTAFLYSAVMCMHYRQLGCAKRVVNNRMSKLLTPAFAAKIHSAQS